MEVCMRWPAFLTRVGHAKPEKKKIQTVRQNDICKAFFERVFKKASIVAMRDIRTVPPSWSQFLLSIEHVTNFVTSWCIYSGEGRSALVNIRRKALLSSVGFRKRMTSRFPRGSSCDLCKLRFDRPLRFVWWSDVCFEVLSCFFFHPSID